MRYYKVQKYNINIKKLYKYKSRDRYCKMRYDSAVITLFKSAHWFYSGNIFLFMYICGKKNRNTIKFKANVLQYL